MKAREKRSPKTVVLRFLMALSLASTWSTVANSAEDAAVDLSNACVVCHGKPGRVPMVGVPQINGQHEEYLYLQLAAYAAGTRQNIQMQSAVRGLPDDTLRELARLFAGNANVAVADGDSGLEALGRNLSAYCIACHGGNGKPAANEWPIIAGQSAAYVTAQLRAYKSGERVNGHMQAAVARFSDDQLVALGAFYSRLAPTP